MISPTYNSSYIEKFSKLERMCGKNGSFIIEKGPFVELMTATGMTNQVFEYRNISQIQASVKYIVYD